VRLDLGDASADDPAPEVLRHLTRRGRPRGADVTWRLSDAAAGLGWFIVGDAAAVLDPSCSHGVLKAIMSGMMAGHLAAGVLVDAAPRKKPPRLTAGGSRAGLPPMLRA
jgi:hypothetical protein